MNKDAYIRTMEENKYKAALERAKSAIKECGGNVGRIKMIESIFSDELWESEEEQTRKQLLDFVQRNTLASYSDRDKWVAWLEKLKDFDKKLEQAYKANNDEIFNYGYKDAQKETIDKVCEWLNNNLRSYGAHYYFVDQDKLNKDLRKDMEEQP